MILKLMVGDQERYFVPGTVTHVTIDARGDEGFIRFDSLDYSLEASRDECLAVVAWLKREESYRGTNV